MIRHIVVFFFICFYLPVQFLPAQAQQFGGFKPSVHWKQISTDTARIIFQAAAQPQAERIAAIVHQMAAQRPNSLGDDLRKINIVLHSNTTLANGYVALGPFRSEYYLIPGSNTFELGNLPWYEHLAVHEYRHVQQYNNMNKGLSRAFRFILGEEGQDLANSMTVPNWFFEGDAVHAETASTPQGRGRLPYFLSGYNSLQLEGKKYSLMKMLNGSLKDYVPNHYQFGYLAVNYGYEKYGSDFWEKIVNDAASFKGLVYPFRRAIQKYAEVSYHRFVKDALEYYQKPLKEDRRVADHGLMYNDNDQGDNINSGRHKTVTNYYFPQYIGSDSLLYLKESYRTLPSFYVRTQRGEQRIKLRSISSEYWFAYRNGKIAYTAYATDARWQLVDYSDIVVLDIQTKTERRLTHKSKYFTPDFSPSGNMIAAVSVNDSTATELHLVDATSGQVVKRFPAPPFTYLLHPRFIDEQNIIMIYRAPDGSMSLRRLNTESGATETLETAGFNTFGQPYVQGDTVYFTSSASGNDELYAMSLKNRKVYQLTSGQTGNYFVSASSSSALDLEGSIAWSKFTAEGLRLHEAGSKSLLWKEVNQAALKQQEVQHPVANVSSNLLATPTRDFPVTSYSKSTRLLNFHSWRPYYEDPEFTFSLFSDNILNTFSNEIFYRYNQNENSNGVGFNTVYGGWYPQLSAGLEYTFDRHLKTTNGTLLLNQAEIRGGYSIPLNFSQGRTYKYLNFGSDLVWSRLEPRLKTPNLNTVNTTYLSHFISFTQQLPKARQHIYPKFGYSLYAGHRHRLDQNGYQFISSGQLYLPSLGNHSIVLTGSFQETDTSNVLFSNRFALSRGYEDFYYSRMWRLSANYHFPIAYPDWGFGGIVYFQRIRSNIFYDFSRVYSKTKTQNADLRSTGMELFFDTKVWNQMPVTVGVRYSYLLDQRFANAGNRGMWEVVLPVSLIPD